VYLFSSYCFVNAAAVPYYSVSNFSFANLVKLAAVVVAGFGISFGPFILHGQGKSCKKIPPFLPALGPLL
jgi:hypothetical protein